MDQLKIIISGYDRYEGVEVNPSCEVPQAIAEQGVPALEGEDPLEGVDLDIRQVSLPVSFGQAWPILHQAVEEFQPRIIIATGLKRSARGIAMERCAVNLKDVGQAADSSEARPASQREPIDADGPAAYWTRLPLRAILHIFARDNIAATLSSDAGTYVCNAVFYNLLHWTANHPGVLAGFVSLPPVSQAGAGKAPGLPLDLQIEAGRDVVRESVRYYRSPSSGDMLLA
ncbi:Pyrrolidone-carboxylate peptidase [Bifidobacterium actinocoloniiforme DSM 22766]|uniref:Pyroglutamyl-peptidase I n=1 Tax=Bifidobacterium actinocoloniiforme DSM 22766 TaxID=1437605 RepID=A0A086YYK5_9BIFI|nr:pyroglutamyl-peptidase I [Bifidobacterium actinocoloniiforme]AKV55884.1 peptidase C15 [Bifidobacterium actinocoloniiforme DSM 22766]KFI39355.1 Pyrrolidone-carboxylate peptidase [Bifidobacterium actinocoloniiforme DSM 22766]